MESFDYDMPIPQHNGLLLNRNAGNEDDKLIVIFSEEAVQNDARTKEVGYPQFDAIEFVKICVPGEKDPLYYGKVREKDKERFKVRYEYWQKNRGQSIHGFPLEQWPLMSKVQVAELKALNVFTVEDVANIADSKLGSLGLYGRKLRDQAKDFIDQAKGLAPLTKLRKDYETLKSEMEVLKEQNESMKKQLSGIATPASQPSQLDINSMVQAAVAAALAMQKQNAPTMEDNKVKSKGK